MAHLAVTVALLFLACVHAAPAPEPSNPKVTFVKDSALGFGLAGQKSKAHGLVQSSKIVETPIESPVDTEEESGETNRGRADSYTISSSSGCHTVLVKGHIDNVGYNYELHIHGNNVPDVTVLDNVNAGAAFASSGSVATGVLKNNKFADNPTKGAGSFFGFK